MDKISLLGTALVPVFIGSLLLGSASALAEANDKFSCDDGEPIEFTTMELPSTSSKSPSGSVSFTVEESELAEGARPRINATLEVKIADNISPNDAAIVSAHVNGRTFLQMRVFPDSMTSDEVLWTVPTLFSVKSGKFDVGKTVVEISNYLQDNSLIMGTNKMGIGFRNIRGEIIKSAKLLPPTTLVVDARSPQLLVLGVAADDTQWSVGKEFSVEVIVDVQKECRLDNVTVDVIPVGGSTFAKRPAESLQAIPYEGQPIVARFGLIPDEVGILEAMVVARADGQDTAQSILIRPVGEPKTNRIDANNLLGYIVFGALSAAGVWLLFGGRKVAKHQ